jgi:PLP dependent protein
MSDPRFDRWQQRITEFRQTIPASVRIIAVTKTMPSDAIRAAYVAGIRDVGESRVQEAADKQAALADLHDLRWHLLGHLQSNKAKKALALFQWFHSIDSLELAQRLDRLAQENLTEKNQDPEGVAIAPTRPQLCLQVKFRPDANKSGWDPQTLVESLPELDRLTAVQICGLMVIPPFGLATEETLSIFQEAQTLAQTIQQQGWQRLQMTELSMGMSDDYALAIQSGSTMIRPGRILFGDRAA